MSKYQAKITYIPQLSGSSILWSWGALIFSAADQFDHPTEKIWSDTAYRSRETATAAARYSVKEYIEALSQDNQETLEFDV